MKNKSNLWLHIICIIAITVIFGFAAISRDNGDTPCSHTYGEWSVSTPATCVTTGTGSRNCSACGEADPNTTIPVNDNHHLVIKTATATCTEGGDVTWECDRDGCVHEATETGRPKLGHDHVNYITKKEASCKEAGYKEAICEREGCNEPDVEPISINDHHDWEMLSGVVSTCTTHGYGEEKCKLCGKEERGNNLPLDKFNHDFTQWQTTIPANCTTQLVETEKCSRCPELGTVTKTGSIAANEHNFTLWYETKEPTCTTAGIETEKCNRCSTLGTETRTGAAKNPTAHDWNWTSNAILATCVSASKDTATCKNTPCTVTNERNGSNPINLSAHNWNWTANAIAATCVSVSKDTATCKNATCTVTNVRDGNNAINPTAHKWTATRQTGVRFGINAKTCENGCGNLDDVELTLAIGDTGEAGGIIFYVVPTGFTVTGAGSFTAYYLESAPSDQGTSIKWCTCTSASWCNVTTGTEIGTGKANTAAIIAHTAHSSNTTSNNAAIAANITIGDKSDWFLPSKDELNKMYEAKSHLKNLTSYYRSSSQSSNGNAWGQGFSDGNLFGSGKDNTYSVRAIRAF